ncbi:MAG: protein kinase, partial [Chloroflexi bacterium]|nr:protein kinase [Chloroflexota bacterium]
MAAEPGGGEETVFETEESPIPSPDQPQIAHNLPPQPTPFIGREAELTALDDFIANPEIRLATIVGPGGMGKTRLALACAERQLTARYFANGVFFVNLAPLSKVDHIIPTMAKALNFPLRGGEQEKRAPKQQILGYLREKRMLLLMDNFEHLLDGTDLATDILQTAPDVQMLVTSRERLHLRQEQVYPIEGLEFPDWETPEDAAEYTAVQLFLQSARRNQPDFNLTDSDDLTYLARICRLVAGMPLAIELAAAWVDTLPLADIAAEIQQGLDLLETEMRDMPERHRSIRAAINTSWQKLNENEQNVFSQLSVFRGGCTRKAAQEITGASLRMLGRLVNKSLVQFDSEYGRYRIHELLRQYGADKLAEDEERETAVRDRHCAYYCRHLQNLEVDLKGARQQKALTEIEADSQNIRVAWNWAIEQGQAAQLEQAMFSLGCFYWWRGPFHEGEAIFAAATEKLITLPDQSLLSAQTLIWQGQFKRIMRDTKAAEQLLQKSLALLDSPVLAKQDTRPAKAFGLWVMSGCVPIGPNQEESTRQLRRQSLTLYQALDDQWGTAQALWFLAETTDDLDEARQLTEKCLTIRQSLGDQRGIAFSLRTLANIAATQERFEESERLNREVNAIFQKAGDRVNFYLGYFRLGSILIKQGRFVEAHTQIARGLKLLDELGMQSDFILSNIALSNVKIDLGQYEQACDLAQTTLTISQETENQLHIAHSLLLLGKIALAKEDHSEAHRLLQESDSFIRGAGEKEYAAMNQALLAYAACGLNQHIQARRYLSSTLQLVLDTRSFRPLMLALPAAALFLAGQGEAARAVELYALTGRYPFVANSRWFADVAGQHMAASAASLPLEVANAAQIQGESLDLWETATKLLAELSGKSIETQRHDEKASLSIRQALDAVEPIERFIPEELFAVGGHGKVYLGRDVSTDQQVVIKQLKPELAAQHPELVSRFIREGEALRQLNHPNIVKMLAAIENEGQYLIVMEYVSGGNLSDLLEKQPQLALDRALGIGLELADALSRAHHLHIVHRDLKPSNVLLAEDGAPRLTDFGIALLSDQETRLTQDNTLLGTIQYMSPEACTGRELDGRTDIWSFGVML